MATHKLQAPELEIFFYGFMDDIELSEQTYF